jgi:hypothetical protein
MLALAIAATVLGAPSLPFVPVPDTLTASSAPAPDRPDLSPALANVYPDRFVGGVPAASDADTVRKRKKAVEYSDFYYTRLKIHKIASYAMLPLFVTQAVAGQQLYSKGNEAPQWARDLPQPLAIAIGSLWVVNTVTGAWNWWDSRHVQEGKAKRTVHGLLMTLAGAGFVATAATGPENEGGYYEGGNPSQHKALAISSMALATAGWLMMIIWK